MARYEGKLHFSPMFLFANLDFRQPEKILVAFRDRIDGFYLVPAEDLAESRRDFAAGILCFAAVDFISKYELRRHDDGRSRAWLERLPEFTGSDPSNPDRRLLDRLDQDFRNPLVHEGRIRYGEFSSDIPDVVRVLDKLMVVNPRLLVNALRQSLNNYCVKLRSNRTELDLLCSALSTDFRLEVTAEGGRIA